MFFSLSPSHYFIYVIGNNNNALAAILPQQSRHWKEGKASQVIWLHCLQTTAVTEQKRLDKSVAAAAAAAQVHMHHHTQLTVI